MIQFKVWLHQIIVLAQLNKQVAINTSVPITNS